MTQGLDTTIYKLRNSEVIASLSASVGFTSTYITDAEMARLLYVLIQPQGGAIRYQTNGDAATATTGIYVANNGLVEIWGYDAIKNFRSINDGGTAKLSCKYYGS